MAQKSGSAKTRVSVDTQKKPKDEVKLPAISPAPSPNKKTKDVLTGKPTLSTQLPSGTGKAGQTPSPKSPLKPAARTAPPKLSPTLKTPSTQPASEKEAAELSAALVSSEIPIEGGPQRATAQGCVVSSPGPEDIPVVDEICAPEAEAKAVAEEAERLRKLNGNGMVKLIYEQYDELFPIVDGSTTQANVDDVYCLSFVMPNCLVRLSRHPNLERFQREESGVFDSLMHEEPRGTYQDLEKDHTYYVVVEQEADQLRRDQEATKARWGDELQEQKKDKDDGRGFETCSCIYGNPCVDEYGCRDWHSRYAIATKNGWKGF